MSEVSNKAKFEINVNIYQNTFCLLINACENRGLIVGSDVIKFSAQFLYRHFLVCIITFKILDLVRAFVLYFRTNNSNTYVQLLHLHVTFVQRSNIAPRQVVGNSILFGTLFSMFYLFTVLVF